MFGCSRIAAMEGPALKVSFRDFQSFLKVFVVKCVKCMFYPSSNYTRNATIADNYISFAGDNGIAVVGHTELINGTNGNQPRGTKILRNIIHDNGVWGKGVSRAVHFKFS